MKIYIPSGEQELAALEKTTHLAIAAHEDDIELMSLFAIGDCLSDKSKCFSGVVATNGASSPRNGKFANVTDEEMVLLREKEQMKAADIGGYGALALLGYTSGDVKRDRRTECENDIEKLLRAAKPDEVFTHNPADAHETHLAVMCRTVAAIRRLPKELRPKKLWGCEVWRSLDWLPSEHKTIVNSERGVEIADKILNVFESQIAGGKSYDTAFVGRQCANATFSESHACDVYRYASVTLDMSILLRDDTISVADFISDVIEKFKTETAENLKKLI